MKKLTLLFLFVSFLMNAQKQSLPKISRAGEIYGRFEIEGKDALWLRVFEATPKRVAKTQKQLLYLGYKVKETGVFDEDTKAALLEFNKKECNIVCVCVITEKTISILKKRSKERKIKEKKALKNN